MSEQIRKAPEIERELHACLEGLTKEETDAISRLSMDEDIAKVLPHEKASKIATLNVELEVAKHKERSCDCFQDPEDLEIAKLFDEGRSYRSIAAAIGLSKSQIARRIKELNLHH